MTTEQNEFNPGTELDLPDDGQIIEKIRQVQNFQKLVHSSLVLDKDFGTIPGTQKPTLLKPGAEKIIKLLGLADTYEIIDQTSDWNGGLFQYVIRCRLVAIGTGVVVAEGVGECNSYESRYRYRWIGDRQLEEYGIADTTGMRQRTHASGYTQYRIVNEDPADQVNTVLKIAKKRSMVDAALSVGRLSEIFTQDIEDAPRQSGGSPQASGNQTNTSTDYYCTEHKTKWFKSKKMDRFAHPNGDGQPWCNMPVDASSDSVEQISDEPEGGLHDWPWFLDRVKSVYGKEKADVDRACMYMDLKDYIAIEGNPQTPEEVLVHCVQFWANEKPVQEDLPW